MKYKITKQFTNRPEIHCKEFSAKEDAKKFVNESLANDHIYKLEVTYRIYFKGACIETADQKTFATMKPTENTGQGSQGQQSSASFRPTPLAVSPRPSGTPPKWIIDQDENKKRDED